jgi:hypothetical protein
MKNKLNVLNFDNVNFLKVGEKYSGEVLIVDFGMDEGIVEDKNYVILNDGEICEVVG